MPPGLQIPSTLGDPGERRNVPGEGWVSERELAWREVREILGGPEEMRSRFQRLLDFAAHCGVRVEVLPSVLTHTRFLSQTQRDIERLYPGHTFTPCPSYEGFASFGRPAEGERGILVLVGPKRGQTALDALCHFAQLWEERAVWIVHGSHPTPGGGLWYDLNAEHAEPTVGFVHELAHAVAGPEALTVTWESEVVAGLLPRAWSTAMEAYQAEVTATADSTGLAEYGVDAAYLLRRFGSAHG